MTQMIIEIIRMTKLMIEMNIMMEMIRMMIMMEMLRIMIMTEMYYFLKYTIFLLYTLFTLEVKQSAKKRNNYFNFVFL